MSRRRLSPREKDLVFIGFVVGALAMGIAMNVLDWVLK